MRLVLILLPIMFFDCREYLIEHANEEELRNELIMRNLIFFNLSSININDGEENEMSIFSLTTEEKLKGFKLHDNKIYTNNNFLPNESNETKFDNLYEKYLSTKYLYWNKNYRGKVRVGIFDSGVNKQYMNCNIVEVVNFTEESDEDLEGHGTYITSVLVINIDYM
jgi:hypothetical protein